MLSVQASGLSDVGLSRSHNEDYFEIDHEHGLYLVADGMGGHRHGEVASRIAVETIRDYVGRAACQGPSPQAPLGGDRLQAHSRLLREAILAAHEQVLRAMRGDGTLLGMGTTLVGLLLHDRVGAIAHVGDSRAYCLRRGKLDLLTQDHTWVNEQVSAGFLSAQQARNHPLKNVVTRALGGEGQVRVDLREVQVQAGDRYLLCSDGLTTMLTDEEIHHRLAGCEPMAEICRGLVTEANARGGHDNITVVLLALDG